MKFPNNKTDSFKMLGNANSSERELGTGSSISLHLSPVDAAFLRHQRQCCPSSFLICLGLAKLLGIQIFGRIKAWRRNPQARLILLLTVIDELCLRYSQSKITLLNGSDPFDFDDCEPIDPIEATALRSSIDYHLSSGLANAIRGGDNEH